MFRKKAPWERLTRPIPFVLTACLVLLTALSDARPVQGAAGPDLAITKVGVVSGQTVTYTVTVSNTGTVPAVHPVQVIDSLPSSPAGMQFGTPSGNCSGAPAGPIVCTDPSAPTQLAPGQSFTSTIVIETGTAGGTVTNCASVSQGSNAATLPDPDFSNNRSCVTTIVEPPGGGGPDPLGCVAPPSGMSGWWPGDNNADDLAAPVAHGTLMNGAAFAPGMVAAAFSLPGANDYVRVPTAPKLNPGTGDFSIDAWVQTSSVGGVTDIIDKRTRAGNVYTGYALYVNQGRLGMQLADGVGPTGFTNYATASSSPMIADGQWHHVAVTLSRSSNPPVGTFIIDGISAGTFNPAGRSGSLTNTADLSIGQESFGGFNFQGLVDEVEFFNRAVSVSEMEAIYRAGNAGKCKTEPEVDLAISKAVTPGASASQKVFLLSVTNLGPGTITSGTITVIDDLPAGFSVLAPAPGGGSWTCVVSGTNPPATVTCTWPAGTQPVAPGALPAIMVTASAAAAGSFENCAKVALSGSNAAETVLGNNQSCDEGEAGPPPLSCVQAPSGMTGWWPGDNNASDLVAPPDPGTLMNGAAFAPGKVGPAFSLAGANDYVSMPDASKLNPGTGSFSIDAWILTKKETGVSTFLDKRTRSAAGVYTGYALYVNQGRLGMQLADGVWPSGFTNYASASSSPLIADGDWHHVAVTLSRGGSPVGTFIIDGTPAGTFNPAGRSGDLTNTASLSIGRESFGGYNFQGLIDEVEYFNRVLKLAEVQAIHNAGSAGKCKPKSMPQPGDWEGDGPPMLTGPADGMTVGDMAPLLQWTNPEGTTQYQIGVIPFNNDGPGINLIRNVGTSYQVQAPVFGEGNYVMLPGMTYTWQVRTTKATVALGENDAGWSPWASREFVTAAPSSAGIRLVSPVEGSTTEGLTPTLVWDNAERNVFYYEVQVSKDPSFNTDPDTAIASVYWNLIHGGQTTPLNGYLIPASAPLEPGTIYHWRVRARVQGDGTPVDWSRVWSFNDPTPAFTQ